MICLNSMVFLVDKKLTNHVVNGFFFIIREVVVEWRKKGSGGLHG